jgi:type IV secretion system protein VirD4
MSQANAVRLAFAIGLVLAALGMSTILAWEFGFAAELGRPLVGRWYAPWAAWSWWQAWGHEQPWRHVFLKGLSLGLVVAVVPAALVRFIDAYAPLRSRSLDKNEGFGTAGELRRTGHISRREGGVVIGNDGRNPLYDDGPGHVLIMGPSRLGKGAGHVVPTLLMHQGSAFVFDPKAELMAITGRRRREFGRVYVINPTDPRAARYNPLLELRLGNHLVGDCQMAAHILTPNQPAGSNIPFWDEAARALMTALLIHVRTSAQPTLAHLWRVVLEIKRQRYPRATNDDVRRMLDGHRQLEGRLRGSIDETMATHLAFLADPMIQELTNGSDLRAGDLLAAHEPVTVFLSIPVSDGKRLRPLTRLVLESFVSACTAFVNTTSDGRPKRRNAMLLLDEFPQLGRLDVVEQKMPIMASYGLRCVLVCQDEDQIGATYGQRQSVTSNCSTICAIAGFSGMSLQTMERWGGRHVITQASKQMPAGLRGHASGSQSESRQGLLDAGQMLIRSKAEVLIFTHGVPPTWLPKVRYWRDGAFRGLFDAHDHDDVPPEIELATGEVLEGEDGDEELGERDLSLVEDLDELIAQLPDRARAALLRRAAGQRGEGERG